MSMALPNRRVLNFLGFAIWTLRGDSLTPEEEARARQ